MRPCEPPGGSSRRARLTWRRQASAAQTVGSAVVVIALAGGVAGAADPMLGPSGLPRADADCFEPFFGTSAAAPHVAAVAALLLSKNSCLTPAQVQQVLKSGAIDIGLDSVSGAGRLDALNVMTAPGPCDDGNPCTLDTCTPATGCQHTP